MILFLLTIAFANPHRVIVNGWQMKEWPPLIYDLDSRSLIINDFTCDNFMPMNIAKSQEDAFKAGGLPAIFFKKTGRFYLASSISFNPQTLTWFVTTFDNLICNQVTIFKDGLE